MTISAHVNQFAGKTVQDWEPGQKIVDPGHTTYRISISYEDDQASTRWSDKFAEFLKDPLTDQISGIVVGVWHGMFGEGGTSAPVVEALVAARDKLPNLTAIFLGDITFEENEISWITQSDVSPLFEAYPGLEHFRVRGGNRLDLGNLRHAHLKALVVESGGLAAEVVRAAVGASLPQLEHVELWLGTANYGATATVQDLVPLLGGEHFPKLRYLGLRDSEMADEIAAALAPAAVLERIRVLDLSLGNLSDAGAAVLLTSPALKHLEKLDVHHHYCSNEMVDKLKALGIDVDVSDPQTPDSFDDSQRRYVAVSE